MRELTVQEVNEVSGGAIPLIAGYLLWTAGGAAVGVGAAYIATHWG